MSSHTAIMKGAVLYRLGMNSVKERLLRDNYGFSCAKPFIQGVHPESSKFIDARGDVRSKVALEWVAKKVICAQRIPNADSTGPEGG
jgi:hypothetical protein